MRSAQLDYNVGILDSPIVDSTAGMVYAFVGDDGSANCAASGVSGPCAASSVPRRLHRQCHGHGSCCRTGL